MLLKKKIRVNKTNRKVKRKIIKSYARENHVTFSKAAKSVIFISDLHVGSIWGCCSSNPVIENKDQHYEPWKFQLEVNKILKWGVANLWKKRPDVIVIVGEGIDGSNRHQEGKESWTTNPMDMVRDCVKLIHELFEWEGKLPIIYVARGSKYHVQAGATDYDDVLAELLGAKRNSPYSDTRLTDDYGYLRINGVDIQYTHVVNYTKNPWGKGNPLSKDAFLCDLNEATRAHVYARGHVHSCDEYRGFLRDNDYQTIIFTTPCSKFPDSFLKTHGIGGIVPDMGFTELIIEGDGQVFVHPLVAKPNIKIHREDLDNILRGKKRKAPKRKRKR